MCHKSFKDLFHLIIEELHLYCKASDQVFLEFKRPLHILSFLLLLYIELNLILMDKFLFYLYMWPYQYELIIWSTTLIHRQFIKSLFHISITPYFRLLYYLYLQILPSNAFVRKIQNHIALFIPQS